MDRIIQAVKQHRVRAGVALVVAVGLVFALTTLAAPAKKVNNGQLVFRTSLPNQTVVFKCTGGTQKTVWTYNQGQGHWYAGPFSVTSTNAGDKRSCNVRIVIPAGYELIPGNKPELTRDVKAGDRQIVNWTFKTKGTPPTSAPEPKPSASPSQSPAPTNTPAPPEEDVPDQVIIVPAEPVGQLPPFPDTSPPIQDPPVAADPQQDLTIPEADEPIEEAPEDPSESQPEEPFEDEAFGEDVGNLGGFSADSTGRTAAPDETSSDSSLSGGADQTELTEDLPGISPTPSADVAASRGAIPAWQQWLLVLVIVGAIGGLAYFGLKYYREHQA